MASIFTAEEGKEQKPHIFIYCENDSLLKLLIQYYRSEFKIITVGEVPAGIDNVYQIPRSHITQLASIKERIDYSIFIFTNPASVTVLHSLQQKLKKDDTKIVVALPIYEPSIWLQQLATINTIKKLHFLFFGNIFGRHIELESPIMKIFENVLSKKQAILSGNDLAVIYPISENDFLRGIGSILFGSSHYSRFHYLFYKNPQTIVSAIHLLKRVEPDLEIVYSEHPSREHFKQIPVATIENEIRQRTGQVPHYLDNGLDGFEKSADEILSNTDQKIVFSKTRRVKKYSGSHKKSSSFSFFFQSLFLGFLLFILLSIGITAATVYESQKGVKAVAEGKITTAQNSVKNAYLLSTFVSPQIELAQPLLMRFFPNQTTQYIAGTQALRQIQSSPLSHLHSNSLSEPEFGRLQADSTFWYFTLQELFLNNPSITNKFNNQTISNLIRTFGEKQLFGFREKQTYLVLLQNSSELRPTGGFIGSVGILTVENGEIKDLKIEDVYDIDGQLKGHIEPPFVVRKYLQPHLYLRDSNFNPDFEKSSTSAAQLYNLASGKNINGIIAVNTDFLKTLLSITGPVKLSQIDREINEDQGVALLEDTIQEDFFPGSSNKKDILNALMNQIIVEFEEHPEYKIKLIQKLPELFESKTIQLANKDQSLQKLFKANNLAGSLQDFRDKKEYQIQDIGGIFEANVGINKVNKSIDRKVTYTTDIQKSGISSTTEVFLKNSDPKETYTSYIQLIAPKNSTITKVLVDGREQKVIQAVTDPKIYESPIYKQPVGFEIEEREEESMTIFAFVTIVNPNSSQTISVSYSRNLTSQLSSLIDYSLLFFKQSGVAPFPLTVTLNYPSGYTPQKTANSSFTKDGVVFREMLEKDTIFKTRLIKE